MITKEEIKQIITTWAAILPYKIRIYLYGSYLKGNKKEPSDIDIAFEFCDDQLPDEPENLWHDNHENWQQYLSEKFGMKAHLELNSSDSKYISQSLKEASLLLYDASETEDKNEKDMALLPGAVDGPNPFLKSRSDTRQNRNAKKV